MLTEKIIALFKKECNKKSRKNLSRDRYLCRGWRTHGVAATCVVLRSSAKGYFYTADAAFKLNPCFTVAQACVAFYACAVIRYTTNSGFNVEGIVILAVGEVKLKLADTAFNIGV